MKPGKKSLYMYKVEKHAAVLNRSITARQQNSAMVPTVLQQNGAVAEHIRRCAPAA